MAVDKDVMSIVRSARKQGWRVHHGGRHVILHPPDPAHQAVAVSSSTLGSAKAFKAFRSKMRQRGWRDA